MLANGFMEQQGQKQDNGNQQALDPLQPAIDVTLIPGRLEWQDNVVQHHAGQGQGADDHQSAGGGKPGNVHGHGQDGALQGLGYADTEKGRRSVNRQRLATPDNQRHRQADQQQVQWQPPAGLCEGPGGRVLTESHVVHVGEHQGRGERHQQQCPPASVINCHGHGGFRM